MAVVRFLRTTRTLAIAAPVILAALAGCVSPAVLPQGGAEVPGSDSGETGDAGEAADGGVLADGDASPDGAPGEASVDLPDGAPVCPADAGAMSGVPGCPCFAQDAFGCSAAAPGTVLRCQIVMPRVGAVYAGPTFVWQSDGVCPAPEVCSASAPGAGPVAPCAIPTQGSGTDGGYYGPGQTGYQGTDASYGSDALYFGDSSAGGPGGPGGPAGMAGAPCVSSADCFPPLECLQPGGAFAPLDGSIGLCLRAIGEDAAPEAGEVTDASLD